MEPKEFETTKLWDVSTNYVCKFITCCIGTQFMTLFPTYILEVDNLYSDLESILIHFYQALALTWFLFSSCAISTTVFNPGPG